jgi:predicted nucleic acid-binding protein
VIDVFIDTNVLLYAASGDALETDKAQKARALLRSIPFGISVQVLQEFYVNATGKLAKTIPGEALQQVLRLMREQPIAALTPELFDAALKLQQRYQISYWDAAIVAAAKEMGAKTIYSEDLGHGQIYDGIQVLDPFV